MTDVAVVTEAEARSLEQAFLSGLNEAQETFERIVAAEAWRQLGHESFADWWTDAVQPVMRALSMRPTKEIASSVVDKVRADEADLPPTQRRTQKELADMVGVDRSTLANRNGSRSSRRENAHVVDLDMKPEDLPDAPPGEGRSVGLTSAAVTATGSAADELSTALAEFPELEHYANRPAKALALAMQLRAFGPTERRSRRDILAKVIQAERDGRLDARPDPSAEAMARADQLFVAINEAAQVAEKVGDVNAIEAALVHADPAQIELWRSQFTDLAATLVRLAGACRPKLRRVQ